MFPSGINKIIEEYCHYKPKYMFDLEWWKPELIRTELLEYLTVNLTTSFLRCENKCGETLTHYDLDTALCYDCMNDVYDTYIYFRVNKVCSCCRRKKNLFSCEHCFREYCIENCYYNVPNPDSIFEGKPICHSCSEKIKNKEDFLITKFPLMYPDYGFYYHKTNSDF